MKYFKHLLISITLIFSVQLLVAQAEKGAIRVGGGLAFGTEIESLGIQARGDYALTNNILLAPDLIYYFGSSGFDWFDINFNGNYLFEVSNPDIVPYVLAGLNFAIISVDYDIPILGELSDSSTEVGLNIGGGCDFLVGTLIVFGELRYNISNADQLMIAGGVKFPIN